MTEISLKSEQAQFDALKKQSSDIAEQCDKITIIDETTLAIANQQLSLLGGKIKEIDSLHETLKAPFLKPCQELDRLKRELQTPMKLSFENGKHKILMFNNKKKEKALAEQNRILAIKTSIATYSNKAIAEMDKCATMDELRAVRTRLIVDADRELYSEFKVDFENTLFTLNEYSKSLRTKLTAPAQSDPEETVAIAEAIKEEIAQVGIAEIKSVEVPKLAGSRKTWKHEVVDFNQIPRDMLILDEAKVKEYIKANNESFTDGCIVKGIKYFIHESLTIR